MFILIVKGSQLEPLNLLSIYSQHVIVASEGWFLKASFHQLSCQHKHPDMGQRLIPC